MTATLVTGPAASAKAERLVERAASRYREDPCAETMVIVPTARHGDQFRRRLVVHVGAALALRVETVAQLARDLAPGTRIIEPPLATELVERVASDQMALGPASYFRPIAETPGLEVALLEAMEEVRTLVDHGAPLETAIGEAQGAEAPGE